MAHCLLEQKLFLSTFRLQQCKLCAYEYRDFPAHSNHLLPQEFLHGAGERGAIYASFGTLCTVSAAELKAVATALSALPVRVVWKVCSAPTFVQHMFLHPACEEPEALRLNADNPR